MNFLEKVLYALSGEMETPTNYGWFHLMFIGIIIGLTILVALTLGKKKNEKTLKMVTLVAWLIVLFFEIYKQLIFSVNFVGDYVFWDYEWYAFPYQLCSSPLYILPLILLLKDGKVRDNLMLYMSTFVLFGGLVVFIYPNDVFVSLIGINIQTMVHHGLQIVMGVFYAVYNRDKLNFKRFFQYGGPIGVFAIMVAIAFALNVIMPNFITETFNMFYIGPVVPCSLALLNMIYPVVPYPVFLIIYVVGFTIAALLIYSIYLLVKKLSRGKNNEAK